MFVPLHAVLWTARISLGTVVDSARGALRPEASDLRLRKWSGALIHKAKIDVRVFGRDAIDWNRRYIIMSNHASLYDIPVLTYVVPGRLRMVAKKELFTIPLWGKAMRDAGFIEIDRQDRNRAIGALRQAEQRLGDAHVWIAPEGTRSKTGELQPFKHGGFMLACSTGIPILPVTLVGTSAILSKGKLGVARGCPVEVHFHAPVAPDGTDRAARDRLQEKVRNAIKSKLPASA